MSGDLSLPVMLATGILPGLGARRAPVPAWHPSSLFEGVMGGFWFDFTDADKLRQTSVGIPPVAAASDPVGLAFDASRWGGRTFAEVMADQPELWQHAAVAAVGTSEIVAENVYRVYAPDNNNTYVAITAALVLGKFYEVTFNIDSIAVAGSGIRIADNGAVFSTTGPKRSIFRAENTTAFIKRSGVACDYQISNVSFREIPGNYASQSSSSLRPTYQLTHVRGDGSDDRLITSQNPTLAGTLIYAGTFEAASDVAIGATGAGGVDRCMLRTSADGYLQAAIGDQASTIIGAMDIRGVDGVYAVRWGGNGEAVKLTRGLTVEYAGTQEGSVTTEFPFLVGAANVGGSATGFLDGKMRHCLFVPRFITDDELTQAVKYFS